ncbi:MAG: zinc-ribbon domain-containing protein [Candidatus Freyarchaeota archaeon]|mgnify:CR=1 FL=1|nr:zinc-ribbon domain-containing protein [Candidatus Freyrarchaeum guaymaensis]
MRCPSCGAEVPVDEVKCPSCGAKVGEEIVERLLPLLKKPLEEPATPLPFYYRFFVGPIKPNVVFGNIAIAPDVLGPFLAVLLSGLLATFYFSVVWNNIFLPNFLDLLLFRFIGSFLLIEVLLLNLAFTFLQLLIVSFLYWLPFKLLGRGGRFKSFISMVGHAYIIVIIGQMVLLALTVFSGHPLLLHGPPLIQMIMMQLYLYSSWNLGRTTKCVCLLGVAFLLTPGIRKLAKLSTSISMLSSYTIIMLAVFLFSFF